MSDERAPREGKSPVGRRVFLGLVGIGAAGVVLGEKVQNFVGNKLGSGVASLLPGGAHFRIYSITGSYPLITTDEYRLKIGGLVQHPTTMTFADLTSLPSIELDAAFQCVTGWRVPNVKWKGVQLSRVIDMVGAHPDAVAVSFGSYDNADSESLSLAQAYLSDVIVAYEMYGATVSREHGGPVRLLVPQMYGYKSLKWLSSIHVMDKQLMGYWEQNGYPINGWLDGSTGLTNPHPRLS
jgi:DMSO/TMAO reductase YedYZ molybdopterin-dependent catalytic subunit